MGNQGNDGAISQQKEQKRKKVFWEGSERFGVRGMHISKLMNKHLELAFFYMFFVGFHMEIFFKMVNYKFFI